MAKLSSYYKQGYGIEELRRTDQELLIERFCKAQDHKLQELLLREKGSLNMQSIVRRANELERTMPKTKEVNFAIPQVAAHENLEKKIESLTEIVPTMVKADAERKKKQQALKKRPTIDQEKTQGYCLKFLRDGKCSYGTKCKYIHDLENAPEVVKEHAKTL